MNDLHVPDGWSLKALGEVTQVISGGTPSREKRQYWQDGTIPWATPTDIAKSSSLVLTSTTEKITSEGLGSCAAHLLPAGTLLMTSRATLGEIKVAGIEVCTNQGFKSLTPSSQINNWYLFYQMHMSKSRYAALGKGSTFLEVNKRDTESFKILCAPLPEQRKIAQVLTTLDRLIEKTDYLIAKLKVSKLGLMHDLFTRGVDAKGHLRPTQTQAPDKYKQSSLGWIPNDWWAASIGELFDKRTEHGLPGLPVMSIVMVDGLVERSSVDRRVESNLPPEGHALVRKGDIAYNMMRMWQGVLGRATFDCLVSPAYVVMKPKDTISTHFAAYLFSDKRSITKFRQFSQGVVDDRLRLYFHDLVDITFAVPTSLDEQEAIAERIDAANANIAKEEEALEKYRHLRTGLMQDLLTGKVRVKVDDHEEVAAHG